MYSGIFATRWEQCELRSSLSYLISSFFAGKTGGWNWERSPGQGNLWPSLQESDTTRSIIDRNYKICYMLD